MYSHVFYFLNHSFEVKNHYSYEPFLKCDNITGKTTKTNGSIFLFHFQIHPYLNIKKIQNFKNFSKKFLFGLKFRSERRILTSDSELEGQKTSQNTQFFLYKNIKKRKFKN